MDAPILTLPARADAPASPRTTPAPAAPATLSRRSLLRRAVAAGTTGAVTAAVAAPTADAALNDPVLHLLRRATFGPTQALVDEVTRAGTGVWLDQQLAPASVADDAVDALVARLPTLGLRTWEVREQFPQGAWDVMFDTVTAHIARAMWSRRQVFETAVDFFTNHLVIPVPSSEVWDSAHLFSRDVVRRFALGKYADMLQAAARHPAMLAVLDNKDSRKQAPNENYGRELLEMHTVGVGAYTEADVAASALVLTGLGVDSESGLYEWKPQRHHVGSLQVLGWSHANPSPEDGETVVTSYLNYLARHPATARRMATKLAVRYVSDTPPSTLVDKLASAYLAADTAIAPVLKALFTSAEFAASTGQKVRTPYEDALATMRILGATPDVSGTATPHDLQWQLKTIGQVPMGWPAPDGYPDVATAWSSASGTVARWNFHLSVAAGWVAKTSPRPDLRSLVVGSTTPATYGDLVDTVAARLLVGPVSAAQRDALCTFLDHVAADVLKTDAYALGGRLPYLTALLLDSPAFATR